MEEWRHLLYYPLGLLFFTLRFFIQWIRSEKEKSSTVDALFWKLSILGNILLLGHYFIQAQYPFALLQMGNALIAWRNLNLMQRQHPPISFPQTLGLFMACFFTLCFLFLAQAFVTGDMQFVKMPLSNSHLRQDPGWIWHGVGIVGQGLFASRFWVQWWQAEKFQKSLLGAAFWWLSLAGSAISIVYFLQIRDVVSIINQSFGMIPYARNLILIRKAELVK